MNGQAGATVTTPPPVLCLLDFDDEETRRRSRLAALLAVVLEAVLIASLSAVPLSAPARYSSAPLIVAGRSITPLVAPPPEVMRQFRITQKEPTQGPPATEVNLAGLLPRPASEAAPPGPPAPAPKPSRTFTPPTTSAPTASNVEPPRIELPAQGISALPASPPPRVAPLPDERPKLAFEPVGPSMGTPSGVAGGTTIARPPRFNSEQAARTASRGPTSTFVGDAEALDSSSIAEMLRQNPTPGRPGSALQLLSDPEGIDFRPYMTSVLAAVKRNWMAVFPESARMGQRGRTVVQFSINRAGQVPKLVIATPAGVQALDRAAVAGVSASIPFPPLPADFRGGEIRLQLVFTYNMPSR